jgi:FkbM family methyltransferase
MASKILEYAGRAFRKAGTEILRRNGMKGIWIDVGAHHGETTLGYAQQNPGLTVYAFEPNLHAAASVIGRAQNFIVIPMAVAQTNGSADFHINEYEQASSLLSMREEGRQSWVGGEALKPATTVKVPTIRLDTFITMMGIKKVDFLKIDTQGGDLDVLKSAGSKLNLIEKIILEVAVTSEPLYSGAASKEEILRFLGVAGFSLVHTEGQGGGQEENLTFLRKAPATPAPTEQRE